MVFKSSKRWEKSLAVSADQIKENLKTVLLAFHTTLVLLCLITVWNSMFKSLIKLCNCSHDCWGFLRPPVLESHVKCQAGKTEQRKQVKTRQSPVRPQNLCVIYCSHSFLCSQTCSIDCTVNVTDGARTSSWTFSSHFSYQRKHGTSAHMK